MKNTIELEGKPLDLLQQALTGASSVIKNATLERGTIVYQVASTLLSKVLEDDPQVTALPNGQSILVLAHNLNPELGVQWWKLRGGPAFSPTPKHPCPLLSIVNRENWTTKALLNNAYHVMDLAEGHANQNDAFEFLSDGLKYSPSITTTNDLEKTDITLEDHSLLFSYFLAGNDQADGHYLKMFFDAGNVIPSSLFFDIYALVKAKRLPHEHPVFDINIDIMGQTKYRLIPWHKHWASEGSFKSHDIVIPYLQEYGIDTQRYEELIYMKEKFNEVKWLGSYTSAKKWEELYSDITENNAWNFENELGLMWQQFLRINPALAQHMLNNPPPTGLDQKSSRGVGIWDHMLKDEFLHKYYVDPSSIPDLGLFELVVGMNEKCPFDPDKSGIFWDLGIWNFNTTTAKIKHFLFNDGLTKKEPLLNVWLGSEKQQNEGVIEILGLIDIQATHFAFDELRVLAENYNLRELYPDNLLAGLYLIQEGVLTTGLVSQDFVSFEPGLPSEELQSGIRKMLAQGDPQFKDPAFAGRILSVMEEMDMESKTYLVAHRKRKLGPRL